MNYSMKVKQKLTGLIYKEFNFQYELLPKKIKL